MKVRKSLASIAIGSTLTASTVGCSAWSTPKANQQRTWNPTTWFQKQFQEPVQLATIWKHDTLVDPVQGEQSGFGARIYFYNERSQAIPIEGDLTVHGYVTTGRSGQEAIEQPEKKFTFSAEQMASQYSPSDLGASYSVWVPWPEETGFREEVTLIATFKSKQGHVIQAAPTKLYLPGKSRFPDDPALSQNIKPASYQRRSIPTYDIQPSPQKESTRITTIEVPKKSRLLSEPQSVSVGGGGGGGGGGGDAYPSAQSTPPNESPQTFNQPQTFNRPQSAGDPASTAQPSNTPETFFEAKSLPPPPAGGLLP